VRFAKDRRVVVRPVRLDTLPVQHDGSVRCRRPLYGVERHADVLIHNLPNGTQLKLHPKIKRAFGTGTLVQIDASVNAFAEIVRGGMQRFR